MGRIFSRVLFGKYFMAHIQIHPPPPPEIDAYGLYCFPYNRLVWYFYTLLNCQPYCVVVYGMIWCGMALHGMVWLSPTHLQFSGVCMVLGGTTWYGVPWHSMVE